MAVFTGLNQRLARNPEVLKIVGDLLPQLERANPELAARVRLGDADAIASVYSSSVRSNVEGAIPGEMARLPATTPQLPTTAAPWIDPSSVVGPPAPTPRLTYGPRGAGVPIGGPAGRQGQQRLTTGPRGPGVTVGGPAVPDWMALDPNDVVAPQAAPLGLPDRRFDPVSEQFTAGDSLPGDLRFTGTPSSRAVRDVTGGGGASVDDVGFGPYDGNAFAFGAPDALDVTDASFPSGMGTETTVGVMDSPRRQTFYGDVTTTGRQPSAADVTGDAPFGWPGATPRMGTRATMASDIDPNLSGIDDVLSDPMDANVFRTDGPALDAPGDLAALNDIAVDSNTANLDDLFDLPEAPRPQAARTLGADDADIMEDGPAPPQPVPQPAPQPAPQTTPRPESAYWQSSPITRWALGGAPVAGRRFGGDMANAAALGGIGYGLSRFLSGESDVSPVFGTFAATPPVGQPAAGGIAAPPSSEARETEAAIERLDGAPAAAVGDEPELMGEPTPPPASTPAEEAPEEPARPQAIEPLRGADAGRAAAKARNLLERGVYTPEQVRAHAVFGRIPQDYLESMIASAGETRGRRELVKQANIFSGGGRRPYQYGVDMANAYLALSPEDQEVFMQQNLLGPGQDDSPTLRAIRDRRAADAARLADEGKRQGEQEVARIQADALKGSAQIKADADMSVAERNAAVQVEEYRSRQRQIDQQINESRQRHDEMMAAGNRQAAAEADRAAAALEAQREKNDIDKRKAEVELEVLRAEREKKSPAEIAALQFVQNNSGAMFRAANKAFQAGKSRMAAAEDIMKASPDSPPDAIKMVLDGYQWPG